MIPVRVNLPRLLLTSLLVTLAALTACRDRPPPAPAPPGPSDETISGRGRVGWTQTGNSPAEIATYRYSLYIDGQRTILEDYGCAPGASDATLDCSAPLPRLTAGRHTLELRPGGGGAERRASVRIVGGQLARLRVDLAR